MRLPRQQLNPVTFRLFFLSVSLIAVCKLSSSDLIITFVVFMLTSPEYGDTLIRSLRSDIGLSSEKGIQHCYTWRVIIKALFKQESDYKR